MIRAPLGPGTIRMALMATMFLSLTAALIVLQPGPDRDFAPHEDSDQVSMTDTTALDDGPPAPVAAPAPRIVENRATNLRQMSWSILQQLETATGRNPAPGDPGSLLHAVVGRAMREGRPDTSRTGIASRLPQSDTAKIDHDTYVVQPDDTLLIIAQRSYGDPTALGRILDANRDQLTKPEDIRAGQVLRLPRP